MKLIKHFKKILIIRPDMVGDLVLITPAIRAIKEKYPGSKISLMIREYTRGLMENDPLIDEIIIDKNVEGKIKSILDYINYIREIRAKEFDVGLTFLNKPFYAFLMLLSGIPKRIGDKSRILHGFTYNFGVFQRWRDYTKHEIEQNMELLTPLGIDKTDPELHIHVNPGARESAGQILKHHGINDNDFLIGIHPGTGGGNKPYLPEDYAKAIDITSSKHNVKFVITGGAREEAYAETIYNLAKAKPAILVNKTTLPEFTALIKRLNIFVGVDSGPLHIAAGFKIPTVAIFTSKSVKPTKWGPWKTRHVIIHNPALCRIHCFPRKCQLLTCQKAITPENVSNAIEALMKGGGSKTHKEAFSDWIKNSLNILLAGKSKEKDMLYNELTSSGYNVISLDSTSGVFELLDIYKKYDINIVHRAGNFGKRRLFLSYLLSSLFLEIPILLIKDKSFESAEEAVDYYVGSFKKSIL